MKFNALRGTTRLRDMLGKSRARAPRRNDGKKIVNVHDAIAVGKGSDIGCTTWWTRL